MEMNAASVVYEQASRRPESVAIVTSQQIVSYAELRRLVGIVAHRLRRCGIEAGQTVGVTMTHRPLHLIALLALAQTGAISLPLHPAVPRERRLLAARRFGATAVVSGRREFALEGLAFAGLDDLSFAAGSPEDDHIHPATGDDPVRILISSGTSGDPKGMMLTHGLMARRNLTTEAAATSSSRVLPMDLNFIVGFRPAMSALARGSTLVFPPSLGAGDVLRSMIGHRVTHAYFSPTQVRELVALTDDGTSACLDIACLRLGGGTVGADLLQKVRARLSPNVYVSYGSTESGMVTYATPEMLARSPGTVGRVCDWATVQVVASDDTPLPVGNIGQLRIRSDHQVAGYFRDEVRTRQYFRDGWFYPGDLGRFDAEGLLYIEGRGDEQLNFGGMKVGPEDIETAILAHPAVIDAGAFVHVDGEGREMLAVALTLRDQAQLDAVRTHARGKLGPLAPARYFMVPELPRTATGKLKRLELAALFATSTPRPPA